MKNKLYTAIGLMSGTSMDGVDVSLIRSDGFNEFTNILDEYFEYNESLHRELIELRNSIININDLKQHSSRLNKLEREITVFHSKIVSDLCIKYQDEIDFVGFHGQTIFHNPEQNISKQLGDGKLMSQLVKKKVIYDFRQEDIVNKGQGAPLTPIFHNLLSRRVNEKHQINFPICFLNIGGISNITKIIKKDEKLEENLEAFDSGPGNCMIDEWVRKNSKNNFDESGSIAKSGKINQLILNQAIDNFKIDSFDKSLDVKDFDISFARGLSLEDGCATITNFTAYLIAKGIEHANGSNVEPIKFLVCGGGRKNTFLIQTIKDYLLHKKNISLNSIDNYDLNGDYIESQAFGYLSIRSFLKLPISYPKTTGCELPTVGGKLVKNF
ncbi:anhydro-N-acetylmuramic acid kinase [uncultured Candidatus Pelagibacter sp.]|uniref:anhydro-N-acetylmuramic acid kinase n=1 Tax=uncultured Candidatus Pelagibacter sp. TaxID=372654 RepID=UPI002601D782|nr:anhydro-N-acetylmuramic acid kinase [uncultured Candidatus Pelagibacter sp.]